MNYCWILLFSLTLPGCSQPASTSASASAPDSSEIDTTSLIKLIAEPDKYEGKLIRTHGFIHREFESSAIYLHREDHEHRIRSNGLWLDSGICVSRSGKPFNTAYALVEGRFTGASRGHLGLWSGEIQDVRRCVEMP